jgi:putative FmdB family regulatory protein
MPLYEYKCDRCNNTFEVIQKFSDPPVTTCRVCGGPVHKLLSAPAIQFKGTGWYVTDYAKRGSTEASKVASSNGNNGSSPSGSTEKTSSDTPSTAGVSSSSPSSSGEKKA